MRVRSTGHAYVETSGSVRLSSPATPVVAAVSARGRDRVEVSPRTAELGRARSLAIAAPEVRQERVDALVADISNGRYAVEGRDVVPLLVREHLMLGTGSGGYGARGA